MTVLLIHKDAETIVALRNCMLITLIRENDTLHLINLWQMAYRCLTTFRNKHE